MRFFANSHFKFHFISALLLLSCFNRFYSCKIEAGATDDDDADNDERRISEPPSRPCDCWTTGFKKKLGFNLKKPENPKCLNLSGFGCDSQQGVRHIFHTLRHRFKLKSTFEPIKLK